MSRVYFYMLSFLSLKVLIIYYVATGCFTVAKAHKDENNLNSVDRPQVEIRAVLIKCGTEEGSSITSDSETARFERDELFKHSALRDCDKKLAVTAKITTEPEITGDEYIPIEHVFEGLDKRIRLLDPYILRLRRELPLQAYTLKRVDTISGVLTDTKSLAEEQYDPLKVRAKREVEHGSDHSPSVVDKGNYDQDHQFRWLSNTEYSLVKQNNNNAQSNACLSQNITLNSRKKRNEHNIVVEQTPNEEQQWEKNYQYRSSSDREVKINEDEHNEVHRASIGGRNERKLDGKLHGKEEKGLKNHHSNFRSDNAIKDKESKILNPRYKLRSSNVDYLGLDRTPDSLKFDSAEQKDYDVYEIGIPELWYTVHVQLFKKMSTAEGKTVWNDLTKGEKASVGSLNPEWRGQDITVRYSPAEWIPRKEFTLPTTNLCVLAPIRRETDLPANNISNDDSYVSYEEGGYIIVPKEDVMEKEEEEEKEKGRMLNKRDDNTNKGYRRVTVRVSRALLGGSSDKMNIVTQDSNKYLTIPHCRSNLAQLDLEARADENELVRVGSSGCISTAVSDSTRRTRTVLTLQVGNTGLAAASFRVIAQDCGPALANLIKDEDRAMFTVGPELIPPRHTRSLLLELPFELPLDDVHCSVSLLNDEDTSVAVRDVAIKKGDRCFCVWHCDCVCLGEDPKLMCRSMSEPLQQAAGLSTRNRPRRARCVCCVDIVSINLLVIFSGVLLALLLLGLVKASVGLVCSDAVAIWGLDRLIQTPRKLDHYFECSLRSRRVEYDCKGWPIHPDTRTRTVRLVSRQMEFFLNVVFFLCVPCIMIYEATKKFVAYLLSKASSRTSQNKGIKKTTQDMQDEEPPPPQRRPRHGALRRWMTPGAQDLSEALWSKGLATTKSNMRPLIFGNRIHDGMCFDNQDSYADSEQDDTEYVLTQMQKSRESLARSQRKIIEHSDAVQKSVKN